MSDFGENHHSSEKSRVHLVLVGIITLVLGILTGTGLNALLYQDKAQTPEQITQDAPKDVSDESIKTADATDAEPPSKSVSDDSPNQNAETDESPKPLVADNKLEHDDNFYDDANGDGIWDWDDMPEEELDDEDRMGVPRYIRAQLVKDFKKMHIIEIDKILNQKDPDKMERYLLNALSKNSCQSNSEDFVISSDDNLVMFQTKLEQIHYKILYDKIYDKHLKNKSCKGKRSFTPWGIAEITLGKREDPLTKETITLKSLTCANSGYKDMNHLLDINLWVRIQLYGGHIDSASAALMWSHFYMERMKFLRDFSMDSNLIIGIDKKIAKGENLIFSLEGVLPFATTGGAHVDEILENILHGNEFHVVYGRFIPLNQKNYYVLSFRTYSLSDMRKKCNFLNEAKTSKYQDGSESLGPIESPYESMDDPQRKFPQTIPPSRMKLPF